MKKILKRSTAILLALLMIVSAIALTAMAQGPVSGFGQESGNWYYYKNSQIDTSRNDVIQGTVNGQDGWWYVVGGQVQLNYTGVADYANDYGWWYIKNGKVDFSCNSVEQNKYGWWYVTGGKVQFGYTGVANYANNYGWWYIKDGKVDFSKTGIEQNNYGWWRVVNGKVDFSCNSVEENNYGWWYLVGGKVQFGYTGVANYANAYGWWYIKDGKVDFSHTGVDQNNYGWWRVVNGKVDFSCNSVEQNDNGWWYIKDGKVDFSYTGYASNSYGNWYIENGKVNFSHECSHNWQAVTHTVHHDAVEAVTEERFPSDVTRFVVGGTKMDIYLAPGIFPYGSSTDESILGEAGKYYTITGYTPYCVCCRCGYAINETDSDVSSQMFSHIENAHNGGASYTFEEVPSLQEIQMITTVITPAQAAWDEVVTDYYKCTICGATK